MNTLPDLSQLTHEQLLEFTRQLAMQHQSLAQSNQQLDAKVQHLSILNQKYEHELALFKKHKFGSKNEHLTAKQIHLWDEAVEEDIAAVDLELERLNADKTDAATQKAKPINLNVGCCQIIYTPSVLSMNLHQPNVLVAVPCVVSVKMSVKN
ncbi:transposase C of IS166 homeodomain protein [Acinetobacter baumannii 96512]|nr:transposase C of IS166 homeodomain protein [Acinetobacter baumannii 96512]